MSRSPGRSWDRIDRLAEGAARRLARESSRRSFLGRLGAALAGGAALPLLPVSRITAAEEPGTAPAPPEGIAGPEGDPESCQYWRHCAIDGFLCSCCGGSHTACPPGTVMSPVTWIGTCRNPADGRHYIISYNDCCGKDLCARCFCNRNEGDRPAYFPQKSNDINWCVAAPSTVYHCSTAIVLGVAVDS
ncbi:MAG TPA: methylamine dehydrogenase light chain [Myxococcota bacterium]|nr:methylamine dehydrogenase light chain [Myxococcota bacterium]